MEKLKNKKIVTLCLLVVILLLVGITIFFITSKKQTKKKQDIGLELYQKIHNLYYFGSNLELDLEDNVDGYLKIKNYNEISDMVSSEYIDKVNEFLNIKKIDNDYYMITVGKGLSNYYGVDLKLEKESNNKIEYMANVKLCQSKYIISYGEGCTPDGYYTIEKPFTIVKEDGKWKVSEYTSIFQFSDRELK